MRLHLKGWPDLLDSRPPPPVLGDIVISLEQAERQADGDVEMEIARLFIHGFAHLLGHDHHTDEEALLMESFERDLAAVISKSLEAYVAQSQS